MVLRKIFGCKSQEVIQKTYLEFYFISKMALWESDIELDVQVAPFKRISIMRHTLTFNTLNVT